jgi:polysaccharide export outer membrane protein
MRKLSLKAIAVLFAGAALSGAQQPESLLLGPGDRVHIQVFDTPEMDQHPRITDSGTVPLLFVGDVKIAGMTPGDAARQIEAVLKGKQLMTHPQVAVTVDEYATQQVSVMGQVHSPGTYDVMAPTSIVSVLSLAGGLTDMADRHITIERHNDASQRISYILSNNSDKALDTSVLVYPGDTVLVPKADVVYVLGDVSRPGGFPITNNDSRITVLQALTLAGSANKTASLSKAKIVRTTATGPVEVPIELAAIEKGKKPDIEMQPNDVLYVPGSWLKGVAVSSSQIISSATTAMIYTHP